VANVSTAPASAQPNQIRTQCKARLPRLAAELANLLDLKSTIRSIGPGRDLITEGKSCTAVFLITEGAAIRYRILRSGQRIIFKLLLPGDFAGLTSCRFSTAQFSVKTLMHSVVHRIPLSWLTRLSENDPPLATRLFWSSAAETAMLAEHLTAVGRRPAPERVAHFLLELLMRLRQLGLADGDRFWFPLTQEIIADALSLSVPYVNRVLHQLRDEGLVQMKKKQIYIQNVEELSALADFRQDYLQPRPLAEIGAGDSVHGQ
jgi:CRP-like cAMP-binding protein